jgi:hypothetical protein
MQIHNTLDGMFAEVHALKCLRLKDVYLPRDVRNTSIIIGEPSSEFFLIIGFRLDLLPEDSKCCNRV